MILKLRRVLETSMQNLPNTVRWLSRGVGCFFREEEARKSVTFSIDEGMDPYGRLCVRSGAVFASVFEFV